MKPMLSAKVKDFAALTYPIAASPKLDGIRAIVKRGVVLSRSLKPIPNQYVQSILGHTDFDGFDGELVVGEANDPDVYRNTNSGVMSHTGKPDFTFWVFDLWNVDQPFITRHRCLIDQITDHEYKRIMVVPHSRIDNEEVLTVYESAITGMGYEGIMVRDINGEYKHGRSTLKEGGLMKVKRFSDAEAEIIGLEELMHNNNKQEVDALGHAKRSTHKENKEGGAMLGSLIVKDRESGVVFNIGTGFSKEERVQFWNMGESLKGSFVKYKHLPYGVKDKPRHPVFLGFRDEMDIHDGLDPYLQTR